MDTPEVPASKLADWLLAHGISHATTAELSLRMGVPESQVRHRLRAPMQRGEWASPARGLWLPVPPEYRTWGAPEGIEMVDALMEHLDVAYYVGWLSAAEIHGAAHQAPQVFQVAVGSQVRDREIGRTRFEFLIRRRLDRVPTISRPTRSGVVPISTREATMLDIAADIPIVGGIHNAATVLIELSEDGIDETALTEQAIDHFPATVARRIGWILENMADHPPLDLLHDTARPGTTAEPSILDPQAARVGAIDPRWHLRINQHIEEES